MISPCIKSSLLSFRALLIVLITLLAFVACSNPVSSGAQTGANDGATKAAVASSSPVPVANPNGGSAAVETTNLVIVFDSSGSMAAATDNRTKMDAAKEVLNAFVPKIPREMNAGLRAYGHRSKDDCHDTELLVDVSPVRQQEFQQRVQSLRPLGQTPISYALKQAAEDLSPRAGRKLILLVSDGEETCGGDPCAVAAELNKAGIDLRIHVVGFDIGKEAARKQLRCIAESSGGLYLDAKNADQLLDRMQSVVRASASGSRLISKAHDTLGKEISAFIEIRRAGQTETFLRVSNSAMPVELPPGAYDLRYWGPQLPQDVHRKGVEIKEKQDTLVEIGGYGRLITRSRDYQNQEMSWFIEVFTPGGKDRLLNFSNSEPRELHPAIYDIRYWSGARPDVWRRNVEIKAGQETIIDIAQAGRLQVVARDQNGQDLKMYCYIHRSGEAEKRSPNTTYTHDLPPGVYDIRLWNLGLPEVWRKGIEVKSGQETRVDVPVKK